MKILFLGGVNYNSGPDNANREFITHWSVNDEIRIVGTTNKVKRILKGIQLANWCDFAISTTPDWPDMIICKYLKGIRKPYICYCHGYFPFENKVNSLGCSEKKVIQYLNHLNSSNRIVANSRLQESFILRYQPELKSKTTFVHLGIDKFIQTNSQIRKNNSNKHIVSCSGGTRPIKGNEYVVEAVNSICTERQNHDHWEVRIYGYNYARNERLEKWNEDRIVRYMGQVEQKDFLVGLQESDIFMMNSIHESFGLSVLDALQGGTSILLSNNCGINELLKLDTSDIIYNVQDIEEIAVKLTNIIRNPNAKRIYDNINFEDLSWEKAAQRFRSVCLESISL